MGAKLSRAGRKSDGIYSSLRSFAVRGREMGGGVVEGGSGGPRKKKYFVKLKTILDKAEQTRTILYNTIATEERRANCGPCQLPCSRGR